MLTLISRTGISLSKTYLKVTIKFQGSHHRIQMHSGVGDEYVITQTIMILLKISMKSI